MNPGDLTTLTNAKEWLGLSGVPVAGITNANPAVVTLANKPPKPLSTGLQVGLDAINGMTQLNGTEWAITVIDPVNFSIQVDSTSYGAYTSGGLVSLTDRLMARLVSACSTFIQSWANRTFRNLAYNEIRDGQGAMAMMLANYPVTSVASVTIDGIIIPPRPALGSNTESTAVGFVGWPWGGPAGFVNDANRVLLSGFRFNRGYQNVVVSYAGGFLVSNEAQSVPASAPYILATQAYWNAGDRGVTYANGMALAVQPFGSILATGQYSVDPNGIYYFAAGDAGAAVLISYGYIPFDLEQAAVDLIGDWFLYRDRIGTTSKAIEQQSITFVNVPITARALGVLNQYKRVAPVAY